MRFRRRRAAALVLLGIVLASGASAQRRYEDEEPLPATGVERRAEAAQRAAERVAQRSVRAIIQSGPIDATRYVLGPGDVLELDLWGPVSRSVMAAVSPEGNVFLPGGPPVQVAGRTLAWARERLLRLVAQTTRGVQAEVRLVQLRTFKVYVVGQVRQAGPVAVTSVTRASEAVSEAGLGDGASRRNIEVRRRDGSRARLDLQKFELTGDDRHDPTLTDGDVIHVPPVHEWIGVVGGVARVGRYEHAPGDSLRTLLELSGGLVPSAAPERSLLIRFPTPSTRESVWVDLTALPASDLPLRNGDQLFVTLRAGYHELPTASVHGEVERPGSYPIVVGRDRFSDLIRWAGGFRPLANRTSIYLLRESGAAEGDPEFERLVRLARGEMTESEYTKFQTRLAERKNSFRLDWNRLQQGGEDIDPLLRAGDVVRVEQLVSTVRVEGQVRRPGFVDYEPGRSVRSYVELAGGFTDRADRRDVSISRTVTGQVIPARSVQSVLPADFIWVPERRDVDAWAVFRDVVTVAGQIALLIFTLSR